jgi:tetratricopeptide (TPR) repeat protein
MTDPGMQEAVNQGMQGDTAKERGDFTSAATHYGEAAGLFRELGDEKRLADALNNHGYAVLQLGDTASAATHCAEAAGLYRKLGDDEGVARTRDLQDKLARQLEAQDWTVLREQGVSGCTRDRRLHVIAGQQFALATQEVSHPKRYACLK